ncbi:MAG TPA: glutamate synthase subunit beta [Deltaproteobacteria bacterium]|nr:glutamate synthase subunit beta [Deltaproteobacteria bacterium]
MGKDTGFIEIEKQAVPRRAVVERVRDFREYDAPFEIPDLRKQAARCMDCGIPFCHTGCPLGNMIPDWNDLVYRGHWREALDMLHSTNNFPEFTGRICPAPCEESCVLNAYYTLDEAEREQKKHSVTIEQIEKHIADRGWAEGWIVPRPPAKLTGKSVAVVGSGPAGLAAAQQLRRAGHEVTVFEKKDRLGGLLIYGIPDFKLEKRHIERRVEQLCAEGVMFHTNCEVGRDFPAVELRGQFDTILLATGAQLARKLTTEGRDLEGVHYAMNYLPQRNRTVAGDAIPETERIEAQGRTAAILGGGFTAADCLGNLNRQGVNPRIHQFEIVNMQPRPTPVHEEADPDCRANILTERLIGNAQGQVQELQAVRVEWKKADGRMTMERIPGSEFTIKVDLVLLAMGFIGPTLEGLLDDLNVKLSVHGQNELRSPSEVIEQLREREAMYAVHAEKDFMTSEPGVFVAGDAKRGASLVVWAIWEGREAARCIDEYLMGATELPTTPQAEALA